MGEEEINKLKLVKDYARLLQRKMQKSDNTDENKVSHNIALEYIISLISKIE